MGAVGAASGADTVGGKTAAVVVAAVAAGVDKCVLCENQGQGFLRIHGQLVVAVVEGETDAGHHCWVDPQQMPQDGWGRR